MALDWNNIIEARHNVRIHLSHFTDILDLIALIEKFRYLLSMNFAKLLNSAARRVRNLLHQFL